MREGIADSFPRDADETDIVVDLRASEPRGVAERVPFADLVAQHEPIKAEILAEWERILSTAGFIGGSPVDTFEQSLASYVGTDFAIGVANGTDAIMLALRALGIERGDEVITAANTFFATVEAISHAGGSPVLVDVDPDTATIDPDAIEAAITPRTRFIVPVHLYGQPADMDPIMKIAERHDLLVVEDNAQAIGATYHGRPTGSIGHASAVSFYPGKNLGAAGDAGAVTTDSHEVARQVRILGNHGSRTKYEHIEIGYNSRLDALQAAALSVKLRYLDEWNERRRSAASAYAELLAGQDIELPYEAPGRTHVYHLYVVRHALRDQLRAELGAARIDTGLHYPTPIHLTAPYEHLGHGPGTFPAAEAWSHQGLSLPMFPDLDRDRVARVTSEINRFLASDHVLTRDSA
jgi:dTDP-4-amino-4,6-dideoxygalactose transaminase